VLTHYSTTINNPANQRFISAYQNQYKTLPNDIAALTYDAFGLLELALKNAPTPTRDEVYLGMIKITHFQGITGKIIFHKEITDPVKNGFIMKIQEGKLTDSFEFIHAL